MAILNAGDGCKFNAFTIGEAWFVIYSHRPFAPKTELATGMPLERIGAMPQR
jgi:hypothetical protein